MKRILTLTLVMLLAIVSTGYCAANNWGNTDTMSLLNKVVPSYLQAAGTSFSGATSLTSNTTTIPTSYSLVRKVITDEVGYSGSTPISYASGTLANGTPGQILTIIITAVTGSGTYTLTPATMTGFTSLLFNAALDSATLLYVDSTVGWIVLSTNSVTLQSQIP